MYPSRLQIIVVLWLCAVQAISAPLKVACIGDSITEGSGLGNPTTESYPAKLQRLLGTNYLVRNFGVSGRTLLRKGDFPYWSEAALSQSRDWNPDIVTIMLGTNDAKPYNWKYGTNFLKDYTDLIAIYTNRPSHPRVLLCTPCPAFGVGAFDIKPGTIATNITPAVHQLAAELGHEIIDLQAALPNHRELFPDNIHPNTKGTTVLAALFQTALIGSYSGGTAPGLSVGRDSSTRAVLRWPTESAGWVLQSTPSLRGTNTAWTVVEQPAVNDGSLVRVTNSISTPPRFYRLWNPSF